MPEDSNQEPTTWQGGVSAAPSTKQYVQDRPADADRQDADFLGPEVNAAPTLRTRIRDWWRGWRK